MEANPLSSVVSTSGNNSSEWWVQISDYAQYIIFCQQDDLVPCMIGTDFINRTAVFPGVDPCLAAAVTNLIWGTETPYQMVYTLPNPQTAITFTLSSIPQGCGALSFMTDKTWATVRLQSGGLQTYEIIFDTNDVNLIGSQNVQVTIGWQDSFSTDVQTVQKTLTILSPCLQTVISSSQTIDDIYYVLGDSTKNVVYTAFTDTVGTEYGNSSLCAIQYTLEPLSSAANFGVWLYSLQIYVYSIQAILIGQSVTLTFQTKALVQTTYVSSTVKFIVHIHNPCPFTVIQLGVIRIQYGVTRVAQKKTFLATDSKSKLIRQAELCGPVKLVETYYSFASITKSGFNGTLSVYTTDFSMIQQHTMTVTASLTSYPRIPSVSVNFILDIVHPCTITVLTLPTTLQNVTITSSNGVASSQQFLPATDPDSFANNNPALCGNRVYSIVETAAQRIVTITPPATGLIFADPWTLTCQSNDLAEVGVYTFTLKATLQSYPTALQTQMTFNVTVLHICITTAIQPQSLSPIVYQIQSQATSPQTIMSFPLHQDSIAKQYSNRLICEAKTYSTGVDHLTVLFPADPATQDLQLQLMTNSYLLAGTLTVNLVVGFSRSDLTMRITETFQVTLLHPCKTTLISTTQIISNMQFYLGDTAFSQVFTAWTDDVSTAYAVAGLCNLSYSLFPEADANTFGVTLETTPSLAIRVITTNASLIGQSVSLSLTANATPQQDTASPALTFTVQIMDPCPNTLIQLSFTSIASMSYKVAYPQISQEFALGTDSKTVLTGVPLLCGPLQYSLLETSTFAEVSSATNPGIIKVQTNNVADAGSHSVTFDVKLSNYAAVAHKQITFTITIVNPCLTTTLTLPTTFKNFVQNDKIISLIGFALSQAFLPATDPESIATSMPDLCGNRVYSIVESAAQSIVTIIPPAIGDPFLDQWSISLRSDSLADIGLYTFTFKAVLEFYPDSIPATKQFQVQVAHNCANSLIQPQTISDMSISIFDMGHVQSFLPFRDTSSQSQQNPSFCGPKLYEISNPITQVVPPSSNLVDTDLWTIVALTNDRAMVGQHLITIIVTLIDFPEVPAISVTFNLEVINQCLTAQITSNSQSLEKMLYYPLTATNPTIQFFQPFGDNVADFYTNPQICGPKSYRIIEGYSFVQVKPPSEGDLYTEKWVISVETKNLSYIAAYNATLQASLTDYPGVPPAVIQFTVNIDHPCQQTKLTQFYLQPMSFTLGSGMLTQQSFQQIKDTVATFLDDAKFCGERVYRLVDAISLPFLNFFIPKEPWDLPFTLELSTLDETKIGNYTATIEVQLGSYSITPLNLMIPLTILPVPVNNKPYFDPKPPASATIQKTLKSSSWNLQLPKVFDKDKNDVVTIQVDFGIAANFLKFDGKMSIFCNDISMNSNTQAGMYLLRLILDDGRDKVVYLLSLFVEDLPAVKKDSDANEAQSMAASQAEQSLAEAKAEAAADAAAQSEVNSFRFNPNLYQPPNRKDFQNRIAIAPKVVLESISDTGLVSIKFSKPLIVPEFLQNIPERSKIKTYIDHTSKVIKVEVLPGIIEDFEKLNIGNFTIVEFQNLSLSIQVNFESPSFISMSALQPDWLMVTLLSNKYFVDETDFLPVEQWQLKKVLPTQQTQAQAELMNAIGNVAGKSMTFVSSGNVVLNVVLSYGLKYLWNMVNLLQFVVFIKQWKFNLPQNANMFLKYLKSLALMEFIDTEPATDWISDKLGMCEECKEQRAAEKIQKSLNQTDVTNSTDVTRKLQDEVPTENDQPKKKGNIIKNLGVIIIMVGIILFFLAVLLAMRQVVLYKYEWYKYYMQLKRKIFYNTFIRFCLQSALKTQIAFCLTLMNGGWTNWKGGSLFIQKLVALVGLIIFTLLPVLFGFILKRKKADLWRPSVKAIIGSLYLGINTKSLWALTYTIVFMVRRTVFVMIMFSMMYQPSIQMNLLIYTSNLYIIYLQHVTPFYDTSSVVIETMNEVILLIICYHFILLTDLLSDPMLKFKIGWSLCGCVLAMIVMNLLIIVFVSLSQLYIDLKKKRAVRMRAQLESSRKKVKDLTIKDLEVIAMVDQPSQNKALIRRQNIEHLNRLAWEQDYSPAQLLKESQDEEQNCFQTQDQQNQLLIVSPHLKRIESPRKQDQEQSTDLRSKKKPQVWEIENEDSVFVDSNESQEVRLPPSMQREANQNWRDSLDFSQNVPEKANEKVFQSVDDFDQFLLQMRWAQEKQKTPAFGSQQQKSNQTIRKDQILDAMI